MFAFGPQLGDALRDSPRFQQDCDRLRAEAALDRRASRRFSEYASIEEMHAAVEQARATPWEQRDYRWSDDRAWKACIFPTPDSEAAALRQLEEHARRYQTRAYCYLKATSAADELRRYVNDPTRGIPIPAGLASQSALSGAGASSAYDRLAEQPTRAPRTMDQAWRRVANSSVDVSEGFYYFK